MNIPTQHPYVRRSVAALLLTVALSLASATSASAVAKKFILTGGGFGHGIGMSQYGSQGYAKNGRDYKQILAHYYSGTAIGKADTKVIRVLMQQAISKAKFSGANRASSGEVLDPAKNYSVKNSGGTLRLYDADNNLVHSYSGNLLITGSDPMTLGGTALNGISGGQYRGSFELSASAVGGVTVVNAVDLDDYVQGVIAGEMPSSWHAEALKTQAVAARSYALSTDAGGTLFDQYPDTRSQVYNGVSAEHSTTTKASQDTAGEVVTYKNKLVTTFFFSTSGGKTENIENVFYGGTPKPYLVSVDDPYDDISPRHTWRYEFTVKQLDALLGDAVKGKLRSVKVIQRGVSPRVVWADVIGTRGTTRVRGATLRARIGLPDTWVSFKKVKVKK